MGLDTASLCRYDTPAKAFRNTLFSRQYNTGETLDELCEDRISVSDIKRISVAKVKSQWFTWDNRRLWVFRHLERLGKCHRIPVRHSNPIADSRLTTKCGGHSVYVRGEPGGFWYRQASNSFSLQPTSRSSTKMSSSGSSSSGRPFNTSSNRSSITGPSSTRWPSYRPSLPQNNWPSSDSPSFTDSLWNFAKIGLGIGVL
ncbi:uncharacterized protein LOC123556793 [Mercenaria mercenaria]|uniref:uncharacterized protein LOC123556793 n=1 Tax=Mercenaria mercenaria TaxID=6596 RepID=UPI001E1DF413|nr:uncharacterized protein LOC123556793 [Mercenaria mercenaria]